MVVSPARSIAVGHSGAGASIDEATAEGKRSRPSRWSMKRTGSATWRRLSNSTVVSATLASGVGPLQQRTVATSVTAGVATFTNLADKTAGTITVEFTGDGLTSDPSDPIVISPAAASQLIIHTQPSASPQRDSPSARLPSSMRRISTETSRPAITAP